MFVYSLLLSLGSMLTEPGKLKFETFIRTAIDLDTVQKVSESDTSEPIKEIFTKQSKKSHENAYVPTENFVCGSIVKMEVKLPSEGSLYEFFFDMQSNQWKSWHEVF